MLRPATLKDLTLVVSWIHSPEECELWAGWRVKYPIDMDALADAVTFTPDNSCAWARGDVLIAFGQIIEKSQRRRHLARITVNPALRRRGHGELFLRAMIETVATDLISLNVAEKNAAALSVYRRLGFIDAVRPPDEPSFGGSRYLEYRGSLPR